MSSLKQRSARSVIGRVVWVPDIVLQGLIWVLLCPVVHFRQDRRMALRLLLDRLADVRLDRAPHPTTGIEGHGDPGITPSARGAPPPGRHSPAIVGGPGDPFRTGTATSPEPGPAGES